MATVDEAAREKVHEGELEPKVEADANMGGAYTTDESRWQAVLTRDPAAEGRFVYAVSTTGVYCRPGCPSRRPKRDHVNFYAAPDDAEAAGYRPCKRCCPNAVGQTQRVVAQVQRLLELEPEPPLAALGAALGLSPSHVQRVFKRATGLSPKQYALARREARLKLELKAGKSVTTALYDAGYGSSVALYARPDALGMTPTAYRRGGKGQKITFARFETSLGDMLIAKAEVGLVALRFGDPGALLEELKLEFPAAVLEEDASALDAHGRAVRDYLAGEAHLHLPLEPRGTEFQRRVWAALQTIPYGETRSYREVAELIGQPGAVRAVARACATNPVALLIPCHRVVRASGALSGYRWGVERKRALLAQEQRPGELGLSTQSGHESR